MIEELQIMKEIVSGLSGMGIWLMALYVLVKALAYGVVAYLGNKLISAIVSIFKADISREEARIIQNGCYKLEREIEDVKSRHKRDVEEYKHLYKILKEAKDA